MTIAALGSGSEETAPRKTAEDTVKHCDGGVGRWQPTTAVAVKIWS